jgi:hypothetical protein
MSDRTAYATNARRSLHALGLRECHEVCELADRCAKLEQAVLDGGANSGGADGLGAQQRLDSLRAAMRLLLTVDWAAGDDFFRAEGPDEADRFRTIRDGCRKVPVDRRQGVLL